MPTTVSDLCEAAGLDVGEAVSWGDRVPAQASGIYIVAMTESADSLEGAREDPPLSQEAFRELLDARPELQVDGRRPSAEEFAERVSGFWLPDETVLYIGLAGTSLRQRVAQYYRTPLGARKPHAGGWFLKLLSNLDSVLVHFAQASDPDGAEDAALRCFCSNVSDSTKRHLVDPDRPFPFANLEWPRGVRKQHGITGAREGRDSAAGRDWSPGTGVGSSSQSSAVRSPVVGGRTRIDVGAINAHLQDELRRRRRPEVAAVEAAQWLDQAGLLKDSDQTRGLPLRNLLRARKINGQRQEPNGRWFINCVG